MEIELERTTGRPATKCWVDNCPARYRVLDAPGGAVFVGKELDPETFAKVQEHIGPGEHAVWVPEELLLCLSSGITTMN